MKILMLVSRVPWPLEKGDKLRAYHQLRELAKSHEVILVCLNDQRMHPDALAHLHGITPHVHVIQLNRVLIVWRLFLALFSSKPFQVHYFFQHGAARKIRAIIDTHRPDHLYCQLIRTSEYVKHLHAYQKTLDYMDALSSGLQRRVETSGWIMRLFVGEESSRLRAYENLIFDYFEHHTIISQQDQQLIFHPGRNKIAVVPNGIDSVFFSPQTNREKKYDLVFTGNMSYPPNVACAQRLVRQILPLVKKEIPDATLLIAGANPARSVQQLDREEGVTVSGWVEDIRDAYASSRVFAAPMRTGSGLQNKLLEAMCMQLPCITSSLVSGGMQATAGEHLLVEDEDEKFATATVQLLRDKTLAENLAASGRAFVISNFDWSASVRKLTTMWKQN